MTKEENKIDQLISRRDALRSDWREVRDERLMLRRSLLERGLEPKEIRRDRLYRKLKKEQSGFSKQIRHMEREINRKRSKKSE